MGGQSESKKPAVSARLPPDTKRRLERFADERELTQSDAVRRLIEDSLARYGVRDPKVDGLAGYRQAYGMRATELGLLVIALLQAATLIVLLS